MKEKNIRIMSMIDAVQVDMGSGEEEEEEAFKAQITNEPPSSSEEAETALDSVKQESMLMESILGEELAVMGIKSPEVVEVPLEGSGDVPVEVAQEQVESVEPVESSPPEKTILTEVVGAGVEVEDSDGPILHILVNQPPIPAISELPVEQPVDPPSVSPPQEIIINSSAVVPAALEIPEISDDPKAVSDPSASKSVEKPDIDLELPVNPPPVNPPQVVITNPSETVPTAPMIPKIIEDPEAVPDLSASKSVEKPDVQFKDTLKAQSVEFVQSRVCSPAQEEEIMKCLVPLSDRWQAIQTRDPAVGRFKFSLFNHRTEDLIDLCDVVQATFDDCIVGDLLRDCRSNIFIQFVETQLGLACGSKQRDFFLSYDCLVITHLQHGARCLEHVRGNLLPGMPDEEKCAGIPEYFSCMEEEILESCNPTSHFIFLEAVQNFGCDIRKKAAVIEEKVADVSSGSENVELQNEHLEVKKLVDTAEDSLVRIPAEDKIVEQPKVEVTIVTTPKPKKKIRVKPVPPFQPVLSSQCTPAIQGEVRACLLPLMEFWVGLRNQKMELNNVSFPIFKYKRGEILNLCDEYANAFLQCDFALFEVCLGDEMVRFANNNLGYLCSPQNIQPFMKHFDCISEQVRSSPEECLELIHGPSLPGLDTMRCSGMQEFYQCVGPRVKSKCQGGALFEFQETIVQFGCRINRFLV